MFKELYRKLWTIFIIQCGLIFLIFLSIFFLHQSKISVNPPWFTLRVWGIIILVLSVSFGVAVPVLIRTYFHSKAVKSKNADFDNFSKLHCRLILVSLSGSFFACFAYLFIVPEFHLGASVLAGLYGIYSAIPVRKKLKAELNYYGLKDVE
jgi:hypothetical protein